MAAARGAEGAGFSGRWWNYPPLRASLLALSIAAFGFVLRRVGLLPESWESGFHICAILIGGFHWAREGLEEFVAERAVGIEILMLAATAGCGVLGMWNEAAALVVLYGTAEGIEELAFARTRYAMRGLLDQTPKQATVLRNGMRVRIAASELRPGDHFVLRPGESVATDGVVIEGRTSVDESAITGESIPVHKAPGDRVFAASLNGEGTLTIRATATVQDNSLAKIIRLVEEAQEHKGRAQAWMERFGKRYSPLVLLSAALLLAVPWVLGVAADPWLRRAIVLLVAAAPCALVISLPIAMAAGIGGAGRHGILIKGGAHLEHLGAIRTVAFDKTGTLTHGRPQLEDLVAVDGNELGVLSVAASLERESEHPLARAVLQAAEDRGAPLLETTGFRAIPGSGLQADLGTMTWFLATPRFFEERGVDLSPLSDAIGRAEKNGCTIVLLGDEGRVVGCLSFGDSLRENAGSTIDAVHRLGLRTVMLTGDNERAALKIARSLGMDDVRADLR
ncbi:MAG TPA: cation-translocating P-type ATPase, partial [Planctomycetes bacterium]|nr:cation-translocating P-type ATPase [Planctomycetota bacterium]